MENMNLNAALEAAHEKEKELNNKLKKNALVEKSTYDNIQEFQLHAAQTKIADLELALQRLNQERKELTDTWDMEKQTVMKQEKALNIKMADYVAIIANVSFRFILFKNRCASRQTYGPCITLLLLHI